MKQPLAVPLDFWQSSLKRSLKIEKSINKNLKLTVYALREAFINLIPYLVASSIATLIFQALAYFQLFTNQQIIATSVTLLNNALPIIIMLAFACELAKLKNTDIATSVTLSMLVLLSLQFSRGDSPLLIINTPSLSIFSILIPPLSILMLNRLARSADKLTPQYASLQDSLRMIYRYTPAFITSYLITFTILNLLCVEVEKIQQLFTLFLENKPENTEALLTIRLICSHFLTFIGMHGTNIYDMIVSKTFLDHWLAPNLSAKQMLDTFVIYGGVGTSLALAISIIQKAKDQHSVKISKIALPFLTFNISEIMFYGLPVVLNRQLIVPFMLVPLLNLVIVFIAIHFHLFSFVDVQLPWTTPIFINSYIATDGDWFAVIFQALLLSLDVAIYNIFVSNHLNIQSSSQQLSTLKSKLQVTENISKQRGAKFQQAQTFLVNAHFETYKTIKLITDNELLMFYQPIIDLEHNRCVHFEALLRLKRQDGVLIGPTFLPLLEQAGVSSVIDVWVCTKVSQDLANWASLDFHPRVSINLHPDTFLDDDAIREIAKVLSPYDIQFEVIERAYLIHHEAKENIHLLQQHGFTLALDDFGTGYSTLENLHLSVANTIKLDRGLIQAAATEKGNVIYHHTTTLCRTLGFKLVAEGIETEHELTIAQSAGIDFVQGWFFSAALPPEQARLYALSYPNKITMKKPHV